MDISYDQLSFVSPENISNQVLDVSHENAVILVTLASFVFFLAYIILIVYYQWRLFRPIVETRIGTVVFFLGVLLTVITTLSSYTANSLRRISPDTLVRLWNVGIGLWLCGVVRECLPREAVR